MVSLGCSKNRVDSETAMAYLSSCGYELTNDSSDADIIIVNTCGFIEPAKQESIDTILEMAEHKKGKCTTLVVTGCLSQRYRQELEDELFEVDFFLGVDEYDKLAPLLNERYGLKDSPCEKGKRLLSTPKHFAYLRIADGCDNRCAYCAIPIIRGGYKSRPMEEILKEADELILKGVVEIEVIAQDTTRYGKDLYNKPMIAELLKELAKKDFKWIRLMYTYSDDIDNELIEAMLSSEKILKYIDIPVQHCHDQILKAMNRRGSNKALRELMKKLRAADERFVLRTSFIVGFPAETQEHFNALMDFVRDHPFDRAGVFTYSQEENTPACNFDCQIDEQTKLKRKEELMLLQQKVSKELNNKRIGTTCEVLVEGYDEDSLMYFGRSYAEAADIDGLIYFLPKKEHKAGEFTHVLIKEALEYDLIGEEDESCQ